MAVIVGANGLRQVIVVPSSANVTAPIPNIVTGPRGVDGVDGATGATGAPGPTGGVGATGSAGATGPQGNPGAIGVDGATGATGPEGPATYVDAQNEPPTPEHIGQTWIDTDDGGFFYVDTDEDDNLIWVQVPFIGTAGATGATGPVGATGVQGDVGAIGNDGADGATGPQGATGPAGNDGATGPIGATGASGAIGASVLIMYVWESPHYVLANDGTEVPENAARGFAGPVDPQEDGFTMNAGDQWFIVEVEG